MTLLPALLLACSASGPLAHVGPDPAPVRARGFEDGSWEGGSAPAVRPGFEPCMPVSPGWDGGAREDRTTQWCPGDDVPGWPTAEWDGAYPTRLPSGEELNLTGAEVIETSLPVLYWYTGQTDMVVAVGDCSALNTEGTWVDDYGNSASCPRRDIEGLYADFVTELPSIGTAGSLLPGWYHVAKSELFRMEESGLVGYARSQNYIETDRRSWGYLLVHEIRPDRLRATFFLISRPTTSESVPETVPGTKLFVVHLDAVAYPPNLVTEEVTPHLRLVRQGGRLDVSVLPTVPILQRVDMPWRRQWATHDGARSVAS